MTPLAHPDKAFDGPLGALTAPLMTRMNRDMESAALDLLDPHDGERLLVVGFGSGLGIELLLHRCSPDSITGIDPSGAMLRAARRRLARCDLACAVELFQMPADCIGSELGPFDAVVAVNCHQLWAPHDQSVRALASVLRPGARLVTLTHDWAIAKHASPEAWRARVADDLTVAGFTRMRWASSEYRSGRGTHLTAAVAGGSPEPASRGPDR